MTDPTNPYYPYSTADLVAALHKTGASFGHDLLTEAAKRLSIKPAAPPTRYHDETTVSVVIRLNTEADRMTSHRKHLLREAARRLTITSSSC